MNSWEKFMRYAMILGTSTSGELEDGFEHVNVLQLGASRPRPASLDVTLYCLLRTYVKSRIGDERWK